jgi:hypothetical protein
MGMTAGDIEIEECTVFYRYRGKGGKKGRRELPRPAWEAIRRTLEDRGKELATMGPEESLWQAGAGLSGQPMRQRRSPTSSTRSTSASAWPAANS